MERFTFPAWVNSLVLPGLGLLGLGAAYLSILVPYGLSPVTLVAGYRPPQPVPFSHALHAGQMKMDCRYCHNFVDQSMHSNVPATATCANCHNAQKDATGANVTAAVHTESKNLVRVRESLAAGTSVEWERVHDLPDYAFFNHSAHVNRGVSCVECHGRVDTMEVVERVSPMNMGWCLDCHRNPAPHLRPVELVTQLAWDPKNDPRFEGMTREQVGLKIAEQLEIRSLTDCSTCHR